MEETIISIGRELGLLAMVLVMLFLLGRYVGRRLLDEKTGVIPRRMAQQTEFENSLVSELRDHNAAQLNKCDVHGTSINSLCNRAEIMHVAALKCIAAALVSVQKGPVLQNGDRAFVERLLIEAKTKLETANKE